MPYTLKQITQAVNHWSMIPLTEAEVNYFLKSLQDLPKFKHDLKAKTILVSQKEIDENTEELKKWKDKEWNIVKTLDL